MNKPALATHLTQLSMQVVGPSVRAFGMCVDATPTVVCEPLSPSMDMLLIPHLPDSFAALARMLDAIPQLVKAASSCFVWLAAVLCCQGMPV